MHRAESIDYEYTTFGKLAKALSRALIVSVTSIPVYADPLANELPQGAEIQSGDIEIENFAAEMNINQNTNQGIIDWQTFNVGENATVNFNQPSESSSTLNRVVTDNASQIYGNINSNGQVLLVNSSGVYISQNARIETGGCLLYTSPSPRD